MYKITEKLEDFIRKDLFNIEWPVALGWDEWDDFNNEIKSSHGPISLYFINDFSGDIDDILKKMNPLEWYSRFTYWMRYWVCHPPNVIKIKTLKRSWIDRDEVILHGMFQILVDFVEKELARHNWRMGSKCDYGYKWYNEIIGWRCPQAGLDHLDWECSLAGSDFGQADAAKIKRDLYIWWTETRPNRVDPYDDSDWSKICAQYDILSLRQPDTVKNDIKVALDKMGELETLYEKEDQDMLIKLIGVRKSMWT